MIPSAIVTAAVRALAVTWRVEYAGEHHLHGLRADGVPFAFALWHQHLVPLLWSHRGQGISLVVSEHRDARLLVDAARRWGYRTIAGSTTRGGAAALRSAVRVLRAGGEIAITPDGPTGPPRVAKRGVVAAARLGGAAVLPISARVDRTWRLGSWDRLEIPQPWARVQIVYGAPCRPAATDPDAVHVRRVEGALLAAP